MAMSNQPKGINAFTIGNINPYLVDVALSKDAVLNVTNSSESFIPIQRIINDKVKLTFNEYPEEAGITESTTKKKMCKTLVLTTTELKVTSVRSTKTHFLNTK
jgi:hypothetical protein